MGLPADGWPLPSEDLYGSGGGSGGSIWIDAATLAGSGTISATGGGACGYYWNNTGGNGGGGRIALYYSVKTFNGTISVAAGTGGQFAAGIGTLYERRSGKYYSPVLDFGSSTLVFDTLVYAQTTPGTTSVSVDIRGGNTSSPDGTWTAWTTGIASGASLAAFLGNRYLQYRVVLGSSDTDKPTLDSITINAPTCYSTSSYYYVTTTASNRFAHARSNTPSNVTSSSSTPANTGLKTLVSFDGGTTWKKHNGTSWVEAVGGVSTIGSTGNTMAELATGLNGYTFGTSEPTLDFAFGLETDSCSATPSVTELSFDY